MFDWSRNILGGLEKRIKKLKKELAKCIKGTLSQENIQNEQVLKYRLEKLEEQKDIYWKQCAHVNWLREGDRNTSFFHVCAMVGGVRKLIRHKINLIIQVSMYRNNDLLAVNMNNTSTI
jgi:hypothetical protein